MRDQPPRYGFSKIDLAIFPRINAPWGVGVCIFLRFHVRITNERLLEANPTPNMYHPSTTTFPQTMTSNSIATFLTTFDLRSGAITSASNSWTVSFYNLTIYLTNLNVPSGAMSCASDSWTLALPIPSA